MTMTSILASALVANILALNSSTNVSGSEVMVYSENRTSAKISKEANRTEPNTLAPTVSEDPSLVKTSRSPNIWKYVFDWDKICPKSESDESFGFCHVMEKHFSGSNRVVKSVAPPASIPSPPAPPFPHQSPDGVPELIPVPCKACDQDRKDRLFIRGAPYTNSMTKVLVDFASAQAGGKVLAQGEGVRGASDVISSDDSKYLLTPCANRVWLTVRLGDEVFLEKLGIVSNELFASNFRHIQVLGSRQYPTAEWRVLGEIETNPEETQEWFDLSPSSQCSKCYVKYLKIRILTHHALEGYTHCALTRLQAFGNTVLQSLDRIQHMNASVAAENTGSPLPGYLKKGSRGADMVETRLKFLLGQKNNVTNSHPVDSGSLENSSHTHVDSPSHQTALDDEAGNNPLLKFIEEVNRLKKQYESVTSTLYAMNQLVKACSPPSAADNTTEVPPSEKSPSSRAAATVLITLFGHHIAFPTISFDPLWLIMITLVISQIITWRLLSQRQRHSDTPDLVVNMSASRESSSVNVARRFSLHTQQFKKRHHGLWRPHIRRPTLVYQKSHKYDGLKQQPVRGTPEPNSD